MRRLRSAVGLAERPGRAGPGVSDGSPAQRARNTRGDLIVAIGDDPVDDPAGTEAAAHCQPGDTVVVKVVRGADELSLTVVFPAADTPTDAPTSAPSDAPPTTSPTGLRTHRPLPAARGEAARAGADNPRGQGSPNTGCAPTPRLRPVSGRTPAPMPEGAHLLCSTRLVAAGAAALAAATLAVAPSSDASPATRVRECGVRSYSRNLEVVGLTSDQRLVCFRTNKPGNARDIAPVSGLVQDTKLVGIDYRPATGDLYGVGDQAGIYIVDPATATASLAARANVALQGTSFGVDFNPAADRLRIISDTGQNLRINVADGSTTVDTSLTNGAAPAGRHRRHVHQQRRRPQHRHHPVRRGLHARPDLAAVAAQQRHAGRHRQARRRHHPDVAADIHSRIKDGTTVSNSAFAALSSPSTSSFYSVDLLTGRATKTGDFQAANRPWASRCPRTSADPLPSALLRGGPGPPPAHRALRGPLAPGLAWTSRGSLSSRVAM